MSDHNRTDRRRPRRPCGDLRGPEPGACLFICHTPRCGSTLLCDLISGTGLAGYPEEYFPERLSDGEVFVATGAALKDADTWRCDWALTPFEQCLGRVVNSGTTPNGVFSAKVKWPNMSYLAEVLGSSLGGAGLPLADRLDGLFPNLQYVWVTRRDKVRQAVSLVKARQSARWTSRSADAQPPVTVVYNFHLIDVALRRILGEECAWARYFTDAGIVPFTVVYEDLVREPEPTVRRLLDACQIVLPREQAIPSPRLYKQADAVSEEWVERYHLEVRCKRAWRTVINLPALAGRRRLRQTYLLPRLWAQLGHWRGLSRERASVPPRV